MNASTLKFYYQKHNPNGYFFSRRTMRFFGDTMRNYGVKSRRFLNGPGKHGPGADFWELWRKTPVNGGLRESAFFNKQSFQHVSAFELKANWNEYGERGLES
jgi:hypothetical protein